MLLTRLLTAFDFGIIRPVTSMFFAISLVTDLGFDPCLP